VVTSPKLAFAGIVINSLDPDSLASFYTSLLGWERRMDEVDWIALQHSDGGTAIAFQRSADAIPPRWPTQPGSQQMSHHLDFTTSDLDGAIHHALRCGAKLSAVQSVEDERILIDPAGNPFCLIRSAGAEGEQDDVTPTAR